MPPVRGEAESKRRLSIAQAPISTIRPEHTQSRRAQRPKRWRGSTPSGSLTLPNCASHTSQSFPRSQERAKLRRARSSASQGITLQPLQIPSSEENVATSQYGTRSLHQSFSELYVNNEGSQSSPRQVQQAARSVGALPAVTTFIPDLSKPKKEKREGYGFSYSETFWCDSDDFPDTEGDTECDTDHEQDTSTRANASTNKTPDSLRRQMVHASPPNSPSSSHTRSFNDIVVLRDVGSFHLAAPQRTLSCTKATREDTIRLKAQAKTLTAQFRESPDVQAALLARLERMVLAAQHRGSAAANTPIPSVAACALALRDFLVSTKQGRVMTGEHHRFVELEIEWAAWLVRACQTGVLHFRTPDCRCRPDWEEEEEEA
ncbi:hypothetical protein ACN47E_005216 [Coniothyrium glycines]